MFYLFQAFYRKKPNIYKIISPDCKVQHIAVFQVINSSICILFTMFKAVCKLFYSELINCLRIYASPKSSERIIGTTTAVDPTRRICFMFKDIALSSISDEDEVNSLPIIS